MSDETETKDVSAQESQHLATLIRVSREQCLSEFELADAILGAGWSRESWIATAVRELADAESLGRAIGEAFVAHISATLGPRLSSDSEQSQAFTGCHHPHNVIEDSTQ